MTTAENTPADVSATEKPQDIRFHELLSLAFKEPGTMSAAYSQFWDYSLGNQLAAYFQCLQRGITPGPIASFMSWKDKGRAVKKGAKAISLCMPVGGKRTVENTETGETETHGFTRFIWRRNWFVLSQTEGAEYVAPPPPAWNKSAALSILNIEEIPFQELDGNCQGFATGNRVAVSPVAARPWKTLFHEVAHVLLGHTNEAATLADDERTPRSLREVEAESVAMLVCDALGMEGAELSRGYIQSWGARGGIADIPEKSAQKIMKAADQIIRAGRGEKPSSRAPSINPQLSLSI